MKHSTTNLLNTTIISLLLTTCVVVWLIMSDSFIPPETPIIINVHSEDISSVDMGIEDQGIYLDVHLNRPLTCKDTVSQLGVTHFSVKGKEYAPICHYVSKSLIRITYTQVTNL